MMSLMEQGGMVMWPIALCALITVVIACERTVFFLLTGLRYGTFRKTLLERIDTEHLHTVELLEKDGKESGGGFAPIYRFFRGLKLMYWNASPYTRMADGYLRNIACGEKSRNETLWRVGSEEIENMERHFRILGAISSVAPLLGLLGTVVGIIQSFRTIQSMGGQVDVHSLAGGIWVAMLTTAAGLVVAIPAQLAYLWFDTIVTRRSNRMSYIITYLNEKIFTSAASCNGGFVMSHNDNNGEEKKQRFA